MKERRMIIEKIPILEQPLGPAPGRVQVLRLVAIVAKVKDVKTPEHQRQGEEDDGEPFFPRGNFPVSHR